MSDLWDQFEKEAAEIVAKGGVVDIPDMEALNE
jgi:hypothetical protein